MEELIRNAYRVAIAEGRTKEGAIDYILRTVLGIGYLDEDVWTARENQVRRIVEEYEADEPWDTDGAPQEPFYGDGFGHTGEPD